MSTAPARARGFRPPPAALPWAPAVERRASRPAEAVNPSVEPGGTAATRRCLCRSAKFPPAARAFFASQSRACLPESVEPPGAAGP